MGKLRNEIVVARPSLTFTKTLLLILIFLSIVSCENPVDSLDNSVLYPISVGNYWKYTIYTYMSGEIIPGLTDSLLMTIDEEISVNIEGKTYKGGVQTRKFGENYYEEARWIYANLNDGLYYLGGIAEKDTIFFKSLFLKYPVSYGETWELPYVYYDAQNQRFEFSDTTTKYTCIYTDEAFNTEAGEFKCIVYHFREKQAEDVLGYWEYNLYYSPSVGFVGAEIRGSYGNSNWLDRTIVLKDYKIK